MRIGTRFGKHRKSAHLDTRSTAEDHLTSMTINGSKRIKDKNEGDGPPMTHNKKNRD